MSDYNNTKNNYFSNKANNTSAKKPKYLTYK